jgi:hypothetical protein
MLSRAKKTIEQSSYKISAFSIIQSVYCSPFNGICLPPATPKTPRHSKNQPFIRHLLQRDFIPEFYS